MIGQLLVRLSPLSRQQWQLTTGLVLVVALALLALLLRSGLASLTETQAQRAQAEQATHAAQLLEQLRGGLEAELATYTKQHPALQAGLGEQQIFVRLLGQINEIGKRHQVALDQLTPAPVRRLAMLDELSVEVELTGRYPQVSGMLLEVAQGLPQASVSAFQLQRTETGTHVKLKARISVYLDGGSLK